VDKVANGFSFSSCKYAQYGGSKTITLKPTHIESFLHLSEEERTAAIQYLAIHTPKTVWKTVEAAKEESGEDWWVGKHIGVGIYSRTYSEKVDSPGIV
jgi:hypothetical protein